MDVAGLEIKIDSTGAVSALGKLDAATEKTAATMQKSQTQIVNFYNTVNNSGSAEKSVGFFTRLGGIVMGVTNFLGQATLALQGFFAGSSALGAFVGSFITAGAQVETFRVQFGGLLGDYGKADIALAKLRTFANASNFTFPQVTEAARSIFNVTEGLRSVGGGIDDVITLVKKFGDATPNPSELNQVAETVGRLYTNLKQGVNFDDPARSLASMGVVSSDLYADLKRMSDQGRTFKDMWEEVNKSFVAHAGNSERMANTFEGLVSTMSDAWDTLKAQIGTPLIVALKQPIVDFTAYLGSENGLAGTLGDIFADKIRVFYGAFKNGELGDYLSIEMDRAFTMGSNLLHKYILDPISKADVGAGLMQTIGRLKDYLIAAFEDGVASFRAGMSVAIGELDIRLTAILNGVLSRLPRALGGGGAALEPAADSYTTYAGFKARYSVGNEQKPQEIFTPFLNALGQAAYNVTGLGESFRKTKDAITDFGDITKQVAAGPLNNMIHFNLALGTPAQDSTTSAHLSQSYNLAQPTRLSLGQDVGTSVLPVEVKAVTPQAADAIKGSDNGDIGSALVKPGVINIPIYAGTPANRPPLADPNSLEPGSDPATLALSHNILTNLDKADKSAAAIEDRARKATAVPLAPAGAGLVPPANPALDAYKDAITQLGKYNITVQEAGQAALEYNNTQKDLRVLLDQNKISQYAYDTELDKAREKLLASNATYQEIAASIGKAAAAQAEYQRYAKLETNKVNLGVAGAGESMGFGATNWSHEQGNSSQQYMKLTGDGLNALANDSTALFTSMATGTKTAAQAFKDFAVSILNDIAAMITKMLILKAIQTLIGAFGGGGGGGYNAAGQTQLATNSVPMATAVMHNGGIVGGASSLRNVDAAYFHNARRFHNGLAGDEFPAILQKGETVIPKGVAVGSGGSTANISTTSLVQNVTYNANGSTATDSQTSSGDDQEKARRFNKLLKQKTQEAVNEMNRPRFGVSGV